MALEFAAWHAALIAFCQNSELIGITLPLAALA
jgi:hypothetical protein